MVFVAASAASSGWGRGSAFAVRLEPGDGPGLENLNPPGAAPAIDTESLRMANGNDPAGEDNEKMSAPRPEGTPPQEGETPDSADLNDLASEAESAIPVEEDADSRMSGEEDYDFSRTETAPAATAAISMEDGPAVVVRYGLMRHIGLFRHNLKGPPPPGQKVVVRTDRGVEMGEVVSSICQEACGYGAISPERLTDFVQCNGPEYPFGRDGKILRIANSQDVIDHRHLRNSAVEERAFCRELAREMLLPMRIVTVDHLLGGERIIFYFCSESRVDFRDLVRRLAGQYHTRIEMRQVGARDEARLVADYEKCGQQCCCQSYLKNLRPVSMRMAKTQKASLDPTKISGRCGRLMCCLRYEDAGYEELKKFLPRKNSWVRTQKHFARVVDTQILTQLVMLELMDGTQVAAGNEEILERNCPAPSPEQLAAYAPPPPEERPPRVRLADQAIEPPPERPEQPQEQPLPEEPEEVAAEPEEAPGAEIPVTDVPFHETALEAAPAEVGDQGAPSESSRRRRRRKKKRRGGTPGAGAPQQARPPAPSAARGDQDQSHKRRRRRRRQRGRGGPQPRTQG